MHYWLMKSEPDDFGIDDLARRPKKTEPWTGVRNYQARNFMREMRKGDLAFFYHSSCAVPGVAGIVEITQQAYPDPTQFNPDSDYYDPASKADNPRWHCVDVTLKRKLARIITLTEIKAQSRKFDGLILLRPGSRLSVMPVAAGHWAALQLLESP